jgi:hypothetical protein
MRALPRASFIVTVLTLLSFASQPSAWADPPTFPDLGHYTPANVADYEIDASTPGIHATQIVFLTPDNIVCAFSSPPGVGCSGNNFPAVPPASPPGGALTNSIGTESPLQPTNSPLPHGSNLKTLPPFHTLTVNGVTCGVDDARMTACKGVQGHGFVLSPNGSAWLPNI